MFANQITLRRRYVLAGVLSAAALWVSRGAAQPATQEANVAYDAALERALTAHATSDFEAAERAMREAHALSPSARTLRGLGVILYGQGRYLEAVEPLEQALASGERPLDEGLRVAVEQLLARLFQRIARLVLRIEPAQSVLRIDGRAPVLRRGNEVLLTPGDHRVEVEADGYEQYALTLHSTPGSRDSLHVALARANPPSAPAAAALGAAPAGHTARGSAPRSDRQVGFWQPRLRNGLLGAGAVLALAGGTSWLIGFLRYRELYDDCAEKQGCSRAEAERSFKGRDIEPLTKLGAALFVTGVAASALVGAIELWQRRSEKTRAKVALTPGGLRVAGQF